MENEQYDKLEVDKDREVKKTNSLGSFFLKSIIKIGVYGVKFIAVVLIVLLKCIQMLFRGVVGFFKGIFKGIRSFIRFVFAPFKRKMVFTEGLRKSIIKAKNEGKKQYFFEIVKSSWEYLFSEEGIIYTTFNYTLPIISIAFFVGIVIYGSGLEYGIAVEYNGNEIGIIAEEGDFDIAAKEVQQRISYVDESEQLEVSPKFTLRIISDEDEFVSAEQLANNMLSQSNQELADAYGVYIDGEFYGAVENKDTVQDALNQVLLDYKVEGVVRDMQFSKQVTYVEGIYLLESIVSEEDAIEMLTSKENTIGSYVVLSGDTIIGICTKFNMTEEEFLDINPNINTTITEGTIVKVIETNSFLPIQYIRDLETVEFINYESIEVETSSLNVGDTELLVKGSRGEKHNMVEVTYVDGIERSRVIISSEVAKQPVIEQIGIGTYTAKPESSTTVLSGNGRFAWPVDGGYISDPFISDRNHKGMDIAAPAGSDIYAADDGVVIAAGWNTGGYGYFVLIDHLDGYETLYGHCSGLYVTAGQVVTRGQLIGAIGSTGNSTGNHLHFEVRYQGNYYNPADFINTVGGE